MNYPTAEPRVPVPSMIPVTVDVAFSFPLRDSYLPRSAAHAEDIRLFRPLMKKPSMKNEMNKRAVFISSTKNFKAKAMREAKTTAKKATGERLP